jgi:hypothetical protein
MVEIKFIGFIAEKMGAQGMKVSLKQPVKLKDIVEVDLSKDRSIVLINQKRGHISLHHFPGRTKCTHGPDHLWHRIRHGDRPYRFNR